MVALSGGIRPPNSPFSRAGKGGPNENRFYGERMRGIISYGAHVPFRRLDRSDISGFFDSGGGRGSRSVASYDEDTTSMAVEAGRSALANAAAPLASGIEDVWFTTTAPAYLDRTNATAIHAALRLARSVGASDLLGSQRSGIAALRAALRGGGTTLVVGSDIRGGWPTGADESDGGDAAAAVAVGDDADHTLIAELITTATTTAEFVDRWRVPGETRSRVWDDRFSEAQYVPLAQEAFAAALEAAELQPADIDHAIVTGLHARSVKRSPAKLGLDVVAPDLTDVVGNTGAAHPTLLLADVLDRAEPDQIIALVVLADGAEVILVRTTEAITEFGNRRPIAGQIAASGSVSYAKFLRWRGQIQPEPARRPDPTRASASAAARSTDWKFGFVGSADQTTGAIHLPPARASISGGPVDNMEPAPMADATGTVVTYTIDRLAYSPSPPIVFAVVDFDGGGRMPVELTDVDAEAVGIGDRVEMTFRRLNEADGIQNYFWKARPARFAAGAGNATPEPAEGDA